MSKRTYKKNLKKQNEAILSTDNQSAALSAPSPKPLQAPAGEVNFFIQYKEHEYLEREILERIKEKCKTEGSEISETDTLSVYLKPEDNKAYYTYAEVSGFIEL